MILSYLCDAVPTTEYAIVNPIVCINNLKKREIMKIHELEEQLDYDALNSINLYLLNSIMQNFQVIYVH
jgi:hypothetical protein